MIDCGCLNDNRSFIFGKMITQPIEQFLNNLINAWNSHDLDAAAQFYADDYAGMDIAQREPHRGARGIREFLQRYQNAFPDYRFTADEMIVAGDRAVLVWTARGTHRGSVMNIPPTGRAINVRGVSVLTIENAKVKNAIYIWDVAGLLRNIGLLPEL
jgi:steroid delta-isomerase-like uncharacterized protein